MTNRFDGAGRCSALLVAVSLILLTAYFGESPQSPLHSVQRGIVQVLVAGPGGRQQGPVAGARRRQLGVGHPAGQVPARPSCASEVNQLTAPGGRAEDRAAAERAAHRARWGWIRAIGIANYHPVGANVIGRDPSLWYQQVSGRRRVRRGGRRRTTRCSADGALVGDVTTVDSVDLDRDADHRPRDRGRRPDPDRQRRRRGAGPLGRQPQPAAAPGSARQRLDQPPAMQVVTSGFKAGGADVAVSGRDPDRRRSPNVNQNQLFNNNQVQVAPTADLRHFDSVQILTRPHAGPASGLRCRERRHLGRARPAARRAGAGHGGASRRRPSHRSPSSGSAPT